jgi:hypothetical protein
LNEQFARDLARSGVFDARSSGLDAILARIESDNAPDAPAAARDETGSNP